MKITKKVLLGLFVLGLFLFAFSFTGKTVKAWYVLNTSSEISVVGASIRTTGNSGLRFVGNIGNYDTTDVKGYGIAIAYGEATNFEVGGQANGKDVLSALDTAGLDKDGNFYVVIFGIPEDQYTQDVSARAYVVLNNDAIIYGTTVTKRSIYQVAKAAKEDVNYVANDYINSIVEDAYLDIMLYTGANTSYHAAFVSAFMADFNAYKGISPISDITNFFGYTYSATLNLGYGFLTSDAYKEKWGWVLTYINEVRADRGAAAITASTGAVETRGELHNLLNLCAPGEKGGNVSYGSNYADRNDYRYRIIVDDVTFTPSTGATGYTFGGWYKDSAKTVSAGTEFKASGSYYAKYTLNEYTITYMDGEKEITSLKPTSYTYLSSEIILPEYELNGYSFGGWYDNAKCTGYPITTISTHSSGNKTLYAKMTEIVGYTINYNFNGGNTKYATESDMIDAFIAAYSGYYGVSGATKSNWSDKMESTCNAGTWNSTAFFNANPDWQWFYNFVCAMKTADTSGFEYGTNSKYLWRMAMRAYFMQEARSSWPGVAATSSFVTRSVSYLPYLSATEKTEFLNNTGTTTLLTNVYKEGYTFGGWYDNAECTGNAVTSVTSAATLYAKWIPNA